MFLLTLTDSTKPVFFYFIITVGVVFKTEATVDIKQRFDWIKYTLPLIKVIQGKEDSQDGFIFLINYIINKLLLKIFVLVALGDENAPLPCLKFVKGNNLVHQHVLVKVFWQSPTTSNFATSLTTYRLDIQNRSSFLNLTGCNFGHDWHTHL